ncbi:MAG: hypothetical protein PUA89_10235, partial [Frisingicoccus sp.]|uniref:hypothetical protein n=1 Tax=Frisingicoccus sp. TaxID=1918627 RepID=UPI002607C07D
MKKIKGRIFAVLLATTVIAGGIATSALAVETESENKIVVMEAEQSAAEEQSEAEDQSKQTEEVEDSEEAVSEADETISNSIADTEESIDTEAPQESLESAEDIYVPEENTVFTYVDVAQDANIDTPDVGEKVVYLTVITDALKGRFVDHTNPTFETLPATDGAVYILPEVEAYPGYEFIGWVVRGKQHQFFGPRYKTLDYVNKAWYDKTEQVGTLLVEAVYLCKLPPIPPCTKPWPPCTETETEPTTDT